MTPFDLRRRGKTMIRAVLPAAAMGALRDLRKRWRRKQWEQRLSLVRDEAVDRDLLEEQARHTLGRVHRNDVILMGR